MFAVNQILIGVVLPAAILGAVLIVGGRLWQTAGAAPPDASHHRDEHWSGPVAMAAGYVGVHLAIAGVPSLAPTDDIGWLVHLAVAAGCIGLVEVYTRHTIWLHWVLRAVLVAVAWRLLLGFKVDHAWTAGQAAAWGVVLTAIVLALIGTFEMVANAYPGATVALAMVLVGTAAAVVSGLGGTAKVAQLIGGLTATVGGLLVLSWWRPRFGVPRGTGTVFTVLLAGLVVYGYMSTTDVPAIDEFIGSFQTLATLLVVVSPFLLWVVRLEVFARIRGWQRACSLAAMLAVPLAAGTYLAANPPDQPAKENKLEGIDYDAMYQ